MTFYAHSGNGFSPQLYGEHIENVHNRAVHSTTQLLGRSKLTNNQKSFFVDIVSIASIYHDLGKLDKTSQKILCRSETDKSGQRMLNHVDAGVAHCLSEYVRTKKLVYLIAAWLIHAHHIGLQDFDSLVCSAAGGLFGGVVYTSTKIFRDNRNIEETYGIVSNNETIKEYIDKHLPSYLTAHLQCFDLLYKPESTETKIMPLSFFDIRMALSCLVDADHTDTSNFYSQGQQPEYIPNDLQPENRLAMLKEYVASLPKKGSKQRQELRALLFHIASTGDIPDDTNFHLLDGPVGTGKTTAEVAYALRVAMEYNCERLYDILPFINIIDQSVDVFRKALLLDFEEESTINAIHSKVEFDDYLLRKYSKLWNSPINVSTAVQFFESLTSNRPSALRKLHLFGNSVFTLDEFHQMTGHELWEYNLQLLKELSKYNSHFIFGSGSSVYYWNLFGSDIKVNEIIKKKAYNQFQRAEQERVVKLPKSKKFCKVKDFIKWVLKQKGNSKLIVLNTIKNALVIGQMLKKSKKYNVYHLSTCVAPIDRARILECIHDDLKNKRKIIVVATSIIECGIDISFQVGFREKVSLNNYVQFNGRINRGNEWNHSSKSFVFEFDDDLKGSGGILTENPGLARGILVYDMLGVNEITPKHCSSAVEKELEMTNKPLHLNRWENEGKLASIAENYKVIAQHTMTIIINKDIVERMKQDEVVIPSEIMNNAVQVYSNRFDKFFEFGLVTKLSDALSMSVIADESGEKYFNPDDNDYYVWNCKYDKNFYGIGQYIMAL